MKTPPRRSGLLVATLLVAAAVAWRLHSPATIAHRFAWPAGSRYVYALAWTSHDRVQLPLGDAPSTSELELTGELTLRSYGDRGEATLLGLRVAPRTQHLSALGRDLVRDADDTFRDREALVLVAPTGEIAQVFFAPGDPDSFKAMISALVVELSMTVPADARETWDAAVDDTIGAATLRYRARGGDRIARSRTAYASVRALIDPQARARATVAIDSSHDIALAGGHLGSLAETDRIVVTDADRTLVDHRATLSIALARVEQVPLDRVPDLTTYRARRPGELEVTDDARRDLLAQRVGGLTADDLLNALYTNPAGGLDTDHAWLWRASGLLIQHPELCADLERVFVDAETSAASRRLILDLLASAGHPAAQAALRGALATEVAHADPQYPLLLQRLALIVEPQPETLAFLAELRTGADRDVARASEFALGAATGQLAARDAAAAEPYNRVLVAALHDAATPADHEVALRALGNAGLASNVPLVLAATHDADIGVRAAAAAALRKTVSPETTQALLDLTTDGAVAVGAEALSSLRGRELDATALGRLEASIVDGRVSSENHALLASLLAGRIGRDEHALRMLEALLAHTPDVQLQARLRTLLGT